MGESGRAESEGHVAWVWDFEYIIIGGELYRAPASNPLDVRGIRLGARWQAPSHMADDYMAMILEASRGDA